MPKRINMPKLSDTMEEGALIAWRKSQGDPIKRGEILAEIETDKADMEFESYTEGQIYALLVEPGQTVPIGTPIAIIRLAGDSDEDMQAAMSGGAVAAAPASAQAPQPASVSPAVPVPSKAAPVPPSAFAPPVPAAPRQSYTPQPGVVSGPHVSGPHVSGPRITPLSLDDDRIRATPAARKLAEERSVDLIEVEGSGPLRAILVADIESYLEKLETAPEPTDGVRATPLAVRMASDLGVDLEVVKGTGPGGRITKSDVVQEAQRVKDSAKVREAELYRGALQLSQKRKALIRNMVRSKDEAPHFYLMVDVRTDALKELRDRLNAESGDQRTRLTYTHLMIKACALALEEYPEVNATYRADEHDIALYESINIGLAVDVNDELVAPTIKSCQGKDLWQLADDANALVRRARLRKLQPQDYADGTFTISNLGMVGVDRFYAIITPPQSAILSVGSMQPRPIVVDGEIVVGTLTTLGLSVDHRVLDGVKAAQFLGEVKRLLEHPEDLVKDATVSA